MNNFEAKKIKSSKKYLTDKLKSLKQNNIFSLKENPKESVFKKIINGVFKF